MPAASRYPCRHRGKPLRVVECQVCPSETITRPVFACALYGECMVRSLGHPVRACSRCPDRSP